MFRSNRFTLTTTMCIYLQNLGWRQVTNCCSIAAA